MKEYIECRFCDAPNCKGCNINTLATMLRERKLDSIMDEHHSVNPAADVVERKRGEWEKYIPAFGVGDFIKCSVCGKSRVNNLTERTNFCPSCGADMRGEINGTESD